MADRDVRVRQRSKLRRVLGLAAVYFGLTLVMVNPFFAIEDIATACLRGDVRLNIWTLAWVNHVVVDRAGPLFDANIFHPATNTLAFSEHLAGISLFTLPVYAITRNPVLGYNLAWLISFPAAALSMHLLALRATGSHPASVIAGSAFAFSTFRLTHAGHIQLLWSFGVPLAFVAIDAWLRRPTASRAGVLGLVCAWQALCSWYVAVIGGLAIVARALWQAWTVAHSDPRWRAPRFVTRALLPLVLVGALAALVLWRFAEPYTRGHLTAEAVELDRYRADWSSYLTPPADTWAGRLAAAGGARDLPPPYGERTLYLGYVVLLLAGFGVVTALRGHDRARRRDAAFHAGLALAALLLSLGPRAWALPERWTPYGLAASWIPGFDLARAPTRFSLLVTFALAFLAGLGARSLCERSRRATLTASVLLLGVLAELRFVDFPPGRPTPEPISDVYVSLRELPARAVVSLPIASDPSLWWLNADYQLYSTAHWRPIVNGYSRAQPPDYRWIAGHMMAFPGPNSAKTMRRFGVDYVVLHADRYPDGGAVVIEEARASTDFRHVAQDGAVHLFEVRDRP
jgi:hypothetical protein